MTRLQMQHQTYLLSGPVSNTVLNIPGIPTRRSCYVYLLGDHHFSFDNMCSPRTCTLKRKCTNIGSFLEAVTDEQRLQQVGVETDVFLEVPYGVPRMSNGRKVLADPQEKRFDSRLGILGWIYGYFRQRIYNHGERSVWGRFHFADIRTRPELTGLPSLIEFKKRIRSRNDLRVMLSQVLYEAPETNRVAKQFHKLRPIYVEQGSARARAKVQGLLREYLDKRLEDVVQSFSRSQTSDDAVQNTYYFSVRTLVMDAYLLARMLYYMFTRNGSSGQDGLHHHRSIVYTGSKHAEALRDFFMEYMLGTPNSTLHTSSYKGPSFMGKQRIKTDAAATKVAASSYVPLPIGSDESFKTVMERKCEVQGYIVPSYDDDKSKDFFGRKNHVGKVGASLACAGPRDDVNNAPSHSFSITAAQRAICNIIAPGTPYNGLLIFHGTGAMKTCSAVSICEGFPMRKVFLLARPTLHVNFMRTVHDPALDARAQCTGGTYHGRIEAVRSKYKAFGLIAFANMVADVPDGELKERFSGSVIVVDEAHQLRNATEASAHQAIQRVVSICADIKLILLTATPMFNSTADIVPLINLLRLNDQRAPLKAADLLSTTRSGVFDNLAKWASGYVSYARGYSPVSFPAMLCPSEAGPAASVGTRIVRGRTKSGGSKRGGCAAVDEAGAAVPTSECIETLISELQSPTTSTRLQSPLAPVLEIVSSEMMAAGTQLDAYEREAKRVNDGSGVKVDDDEPAEDDGTGYYVDDDEETGISRSGRARQVCNIAFPSGRIGRNGFLAAFEMHAGSRTWRYRRGVPEFLSQVACKSHACKISAIADCVTSSQARDCLKVVYSRWIWSGVLPMAVALEHRGYRLYTHGTANSSSPCYAIISGMREHGDPNRILQVARSIENIRGKIINVLLMTDRGSEGLDFRFVRELHVMEPWFHMKKIEQIVGRTSRHCSHSALPLEERNVTVYLHAAARPNSKIETTDMRTFRRALSKEKAILHAEAALVRASFPAPAPQGHAAYDVSMISAQGRKVRVRGDAVMAHSQHRKMQPMHDDSTFDPARHVDLKILRQVIVERLLMPDQHMRGCSLSELVTHCFPSYADVWARNKQMDRWAIASVIAAIDASENGKDGDGTTMIRRGGDRVFLHRSEQDNDQKNDENMLKLSTKTMRTSTSNAKGHSSASATSNHLTSTEHGAGPDPDELLRRCHEVMQFIRPHIETTDIDDSTMPTEIVDYVVDRLGSGEVVGAAVAAWSRPKSALARSVLDSMQRAKVITRTSNGAVLRSPYAKGACYIIGARKKGGAVTLRPCVTGEHAPNIVSPEQTLHRALDDPWVRGGFMDRPPRPTSVTRDTGRVFVFKLATSDNKRGSVCEQTSTLKNHAMIGAIERLGTRSAKGIRLRHGTQNVPKKVACVLMELMLRREAPDSFKRPLSVTYDRADVE